VEHAIGAELEATGPSDALSRAGFACVLIAVPLVTCNALRATENVTYGDIPLALGALLLLCVWLRSGHRRGVVPLGFLVGGFLLLVTGLVSSLPSENADSLVPTLRFILTAVAVPLIIMFAASTPHRVGRLVDAWLLAAALNAAAGALDLLGVTHIGASLTDVDFAGALDRATGLTGHPNHLGLVAAMALPIAIARLGLPGFRGLAALALVPLLVVGVFASGSRGALLAAAGGVVIFFVFAIQTRLARTTALLLAATALAFVIVFSVVGNNELTGSVAIERLGGGSGAAQSDAERRQTLEDSVDEAGEHLIVGQGFAVIRTAHNIYLQMLQAGGLLALAGCVVLPGARVRRARWLARPTPTSPRWLTALAAGSGASICVWLLFGMVGNAVYDRYLYIPAGLALALALVQTQFFADTQPAQPAPPSVSPSRPSTRGRARPAAQLGGR
jgi:O-antigen ligase